ncbi:DUF3667 domain-containing protein [Pseudoxanthomonas sp.]|uniref:DUF3667 domain-containing protein n=1 Tax=Pseudoxanthomonas sp. TaxID=1871049 RepID=UPI002637B0A4|nr:DUF3667 domain-containing protein [Pseudoxanthomonas sp.]WDS37878.1 MAG: DUF3667 domain-containing protein [Pseudoxanthomonas sp.]
MNTLDGDHIAASACENCATPLQGHYCHQCGQHAHNPLNSFVHAIEEVFESFWHLDGRIVRTLRDLLVPGRLAARFLGGHRAPYIPPLRLFVILSVLTFFVAQFAIHFSSPDGGFDLSRPVARGEVGEYAGDASVAAVEQHRDRQLAELQRALDQQPAVPGVGKALQIGMARTRALAQARIAQLDPGHAAPASEQAPAQDAVTEATPVEQMTGNLFDHNGKAWDEHTNPVTFDALPGFANRWLNHKIARAQGNVHRYSQDLEAFKEALIGAVPTALFLLVPVFALLLKLFYLGSGRGYLEHLVVGLYSHAFMVLTLLAIFLLRICGAALAMHAPWTGVVTGLAEGLLWLWLPVYLWWMQWRVYGKAWWLTSIKYLVIGNLYLVLVAFAALLPVISSFIH